MTAQRRTRRQLTKLGRAGYRAMHAGLIPGSEDQIDHLVVGPAGLFYDSSTDRLYVAAEGDNQIYVIKNASSTGNAGSPSCGLYVCGTGVTCPMTCTVDMNCATGDYCNTTTHACVAAQPNGATCGEPRVARLSRQMHVQRNHVVIGQRF